MEKYPLEYTNANNQERDGLGRKGRIIKILSKITESGILISVSEETLIIYLTTIYEALCACTNLSAEEKTLKKEINQIFVEINQL
jgi:hypothetical protein